MENHTCSYQYYNYRNLLGKEQTAQQPKAPLRLLQEPSVNPPPDTDITETETIIEDPKKSEPITKKVVGAFNDVLKFFASPDENESVANVAPVENVAPITTTTTEYTPPPPVPVASGGGGNSHINHKGGGGQFNMDTHSLMRKNRMLHHRVQQLEKELYMVRKKH
tara:strand:+ start:59 stop:553 length:495 start_codon:yes stop_codon:yes gene_type:complete